MSEKLLLTTKELQQLLSCSRNTAVDLGTKAEARFQMGRAVRWKLDKIKEYLKEAQK